MKNKKQDVIKRSIGNYDYTGVRMFTCSECAFCNNCYCEIYRRRINPDKRACNEFEER